MALSGDRVYWIQGVQDGEWRNLHHCRSQEDAVVLLGEYVARDKFKELRLSEAAPSETGGEPTYTEIALMRDGRLVDTDYDQLPAPAEDGMIDEARREPRLSQPFSVRNALPSPKEPRQEAVGKPVVAERAVAEISTKTAQSAEPAPKPPKPSHPFGSPNAPMPVARTPQVSARAAQPAPQPTQPVQSHDRPPRQPAQTAAQTTQQAAPQHQGQPTQRPQQQAKPQKPGRKKQQPSPRRKATADPATKVNSPPRFKDVLPAPRYDHARYQQANLPGMEHPARRRISGVWLTLVLASAIVAGVVMSSFDPRFARTFYEKITAQGTGSAATTATDLAAVLRKDDAAALAKLLKQGLDPNSRAKDGTPILLTAAQDHALDSIRLLLKSGADPKAVTPKGMTILHSAAADGLTAPLRLMIDAGTNVNLAAGPDKCTTALSMAATRGHLRTVQMLLSRDASLDARGGCTADLLDNRTIRPAVRVALERAYGQRIKEDQKISESHVAKLREARRPVPQSPDAFEEDLFNAIDGGDAERVRYLLANRSEFIQLDSLAKFMSDGFGTGYRNAVDYALLHRKKPIAATLMNAGLVPSLGLLHGAIGAGSEKDMRDVAHFLIDNGADLNTPYKGMTALMRAAHAGDRELTNRMLASGADPTVATRDGRSAADFAALGKDKDLRELLVVRSQSKKYSDIMMGLSWFDDFEKVRTRARQCCDMGSRYVVCTIKTNAWLQDVESVEAQFDRKANNRLVAIEINSKLIKDQTSAGDDARRRFEQVLRSIKSRLPKDHIGVATRQAPEGVPFWEGLKPEVKAGEYRAYWSDEDKNRPVFVYLKLLGSGTKEGRYKIVIGNPFRVG
jgi:ankyrin repeat protein